MHITIVCEAGLEYLDQNILLLCVYSEGMEQIHNQILLYIFLKAALCSRTK